LDIRLALVTAYSQNELKYSRLFKITFLNS